MREAEDGVDRFVGQLAGFDAGAADSRDALLFAERLQAAVYANGGGGILRGAADPDDDAAGWSAPPPRRGRGGLDPRSRG